MSQDTLSDVLRTVRLRGAVFFYVSGGREWAAEAPASKDIASAVMPGAEHVIEYHVGDIGGLTVEETAARYPGFEHRGLDERGCWAEFGGESYEDVQSRLARFIERVSTEHHEYDVIAVAHGGSLYQLLKLWCGWPAPGHWRPLSAAPRPAPVPACRWSGSAH